MRKAEDLLLAKSADYNRVHPFSDYLIYGNESAFQYIWTKVLRLSSLLQGKTEPKNEAIEDTLLDPACYAHLLLAWRQHENAQAVKAREDGLWGKFISKAPPFEGAVAPDNWASLSPEVKREMIRAHLSCLPDAKDNYWDPITGRKLGPTGMVGPWWDLASPQQRTEAILSHFGALPENYGP